MNTTASIPETRYRTTDGVHIRYADSGGSHETTVLLTSPWPECIYAFAPVWETLAQRTRVFAVDLPGFGRSERNDDIMTPRAMGEFLSRLVDDADLGRPFVVAPDVGTPAALFAGAAHPDRFAGLVVGGGGVAYPIDLGEPLASWVLDPDLNRYRHVDPHVIVNAAVDNHAGDIPDDIRADYLASYEGDRFLESMRYVRRYPEQLPVLAGLLPDLVVPVTVIAGRHDHVVPPANASFIVDRVQRGRTVVLDAGHFVWEEVPDQYAAAVLDAVDRDGSNRP